MYDQRSQWDQMRLPNGPKMGSKGEEEPRICENLGRVSVCGRSQTLVEAALKILNVADPFEKAELGELTARLWFEGSISRAYEPSIYLSAPDRPARLSNVKLVAPQLMPKLGKAGSLQSRQAILHSLVHTESWAIDLSWDIIARFGKQERMPNEFFSDFVKVAQDEGRHFKLLAVRLEELGSCYGAFPAHDGLWDSAMATSGDLLARLAVEHCVHEARGLDVLPTTISRFRNGGDEHTAKLLETVVYPEEITHCAAGLKWFKYLCIRTSMELEKKTPIPCCLGSRNTSPEEDDSREQVFDDVENSLVGDCHGPVAETERIDDSDVLATFHATVRRYFRGPLKPPFNEQARKAAGFGPQWYEPLAVKEVAHKP